MNYIKINGSRYNLVDNGIQFENGLNLTFESDNTFENVMNDFSKLDNITIYGCIVQDDGTETDEYIAAKYSEYKKLLELKYNLNANTFTATMAIPNETENRLSEIEEALNFLLMGGEE